MVQTDISDRPPMGECIYSCSLYTSAIIKHTCYFVSTIKAVSSDKKRVLLVYWILN